MLPKRAILSPLDMEKWKKSKAFSDYTGFINMLNDAAKGTQTISQEYSIQISQRVQCVLDLLEKLNKWVDEVPAIQQPQRFGNKAFKAWLTKVKENSKELLIEYLKSEAYNEYAEEISIYLNDSFGNDTRIDYGTGHELTFAMFLMCLFKIGAFTNEDSKAVVVEVFGKYLALARKLQITYQMEPAGSHGVWSLDDFQFLPFIFGSAQLLNQDQIEPKDFVEQRTIDMYQEKYMFFDSLKYITSVKTGPFAEHSNQLWNISSVHAWSKVNGGLIKMYHAEVLLKFPVVQHILFGTLVDFSPV